MFGFVGMGWLGWLGVGFDTDGVVKGPLLGCLVVYCGYLVPYIPLYSGYGCFILSSACLPR